ncbi:type II toxin-antitoxin system HipA family toxin [Sphingomonas sp. H39-1-10]|uniref:type II toxin-antitoxin system HipA family toxin n=1 Tax=Sphingomonas pollutisoli TaxID=3030829 RepID=UPI0023B9E0E0|nr:type II toxin-antitoxin system HipA family toxin [Sphingomonas pollutisoli]MDF0491405.1 type II toxin-antitoxin system HipA family toxin [Sphingomonas pollutisoli]
MTSEPRLHGAAPHDEAYVWIWLPGAIEPVVAGLLTRARDGRLTFNYGRSYLARTDAIAIYDPELPLRSGAIATSNRMTLPSCIRDGSPDAWGRRVIINRMTGLKAGEAGAVELDELTYLLESGSDRIGMLDFQLSPSGYVPRQGQNATLAELMESADRVDRGIPLTPELDQALQHGSSLGGARPKALIDDGDRKYIAKFSAAGDLYNVVKAEYVAMRLAARAGLAVAPVKLERALGKDVLLIERFDRTRFEAGWARRGVVSALTVLDLDESEARYASYEDLASVIRHRFGDPAATLMELFGRILFNILCGNTDDHARNHAAFWDGATLRLTPAYDICPQGRTGGEAAQAMLILGNRRLSQVSLCLEAASVFLLDDRRARAIVAHQLATITADWDMVCAEAALGEAERAFLWRRQFLNPFALQGLPEDLLPGA